MRICRLELRAFGPFTDVTLDFGDRPDRLHIVYGANEAGKSSALRAVRQLLFGIDQRTDDAFLHKYSELRVGALLEGCDGQRLEVVRRKALRDSLRGADDRAVVDPVRLERMLGGLSRELYEQMFGLTHQVLVKGGHELSQGRGDLGQLLFSAGAGTNELRRVQQELSAEAAAMFKSGNASNPLINQSLREWNDARRALKHATLPSTVWAKCEEACRHTAEQKRQVEGRLAACRRQREKLATIARARPLIAACRRLRRDLAALGSLPALSEEFATERRQVEADLAASRSVASLARRSLAELDHQLAECEAPASLLAAAEQIDELQRQLGSVLKADFDQVGLRSLIEQGEGAVARLLRELRPDVALANVDSLRLTRAQRERVQALLVEQASLMARDKQARQQLEALCKSLAASEEALAEQPPAVDTASLRRTISRVAKHGALEEQVIEGAERVAVLERQIASESAKLIGWSGDRSAADSLRVPSVAAVEDYERRLRCADEEVARASDSASRSRADADSLRLQIEEMRALSEPPSEYALVEARALRDEAWRVVRRRLLGESQGSSEAENLAVTDLAALVEGFEARQSCADDLADELRRDADRASRYALLQVQARENVRQIGVREHELSSARIKREKLLEEWDALWNPLGVKAGTPTEMRNWLARHERIVELGYRLRDERCRAQQLEARIGAARGELITQLESLGVSACDDLAELLRHGESICVAEDERHTARTLLESEVRRLRAERSAVEQLVRESNQRLADWQASWTTAVAPLGLLGNATPEEATAVLSGVVELFEKLDAAARDRQRVAAIDADRAAFERNVRELASRVAPDLTAAPAYVAAARIRDRLTKARQLHARRSALEAERLRVEGRLHEAQLALIALESKLAGLCCQADCPTADELAAVEQRVARGRELESNLRAVEQQLLESAGERCLEEFMNEAEMELEDAADLDARMIQIDDEIADLEQLRDGLARDLGAAEAELRAMNGAPGAAEAAEHAESIRAKLVGQVECYARIRLAEALLREAIDQNREKHQGPVLRRAGELFAQLTVGSFAGLRQEIDDDGQPVLVGVRTGSAAHVTVEGMSEGTCDQLYLALRLACLEQCLDSRESVPLVVDDILVNFDNARSQATLRVLSQVAQRTQVLLFTHHEHLLELAAAALDPCAWREHRLEPVVAAIGPQAASASV